MSLTTLQLFNRVARLTGNIGTDLTVLTSLTNHQTMIFTIMEQVFRELSVKTLWTPLRKEGTITLATDDNDYAFETDMHKEDPSTFLYDNSRHILKATPEEIEMIRSDRTTTGTPKLYYKEGGYFKFDRVPSSVTNGKTIVYWYFYVPDLPAIASPTATHWIPTEFEDTVFVNWCVFRVFLARENNQALTYMRLKDDALVDMLYAYKDPAVNVTRPRKGIIGQGGSRSASGKEGLADYGWDAA